MRLYMLIIKTKMKNHWTIVIFSSNVSDLALYGKGQYGRQHIPYDVITHVEGKTFRSDLNHSFYGWNTAAQGFYHEKKKHGE